MRRVQDDQLGAVGNQRGQFFDVDGKVTLFAQRNRDRLPERILDHRLVDRETGVGIDNFIPSINQCQYHKENNRLATWHNDDFVARNRHAAGAADIVCDCLAQLGQSGGGTVMGPSLVKSVDTSLDDIGGRVEVGFTDFEVNNLFALFLELAGAVQDFKSSFGAKPRHPAGKTQFVQSSGWHSG